ncbi:glycosyltransferase [Pseudodesulfovibrio methanolicus]|uniref:Glycosyltransferase n=1 Tax=Pseudodesulfovibrio methanolicus TaxID=3126690 RepID=A0ABZ2ITT3_9BACT
MDRKTTNAYYTFMCMTDIWLVMPCFNERNRLSRESVDQFLAYAPDGHLCLVDDGSRDGTHELLLDLQRRSPDTVTVLRHTSNKGKAEAVRTGILHGASKSDHAYVGYWDADLATPFSQLPLFFAEMGKTPCGEIFMGCRHQRLGTAIERKWTRHYSGRVFATAASQVLGLPVYDTQCGAKLLLRETAVPLFQEPFLTTWVFDVELLARFLAAKGRQKALDAIREIPLERWTDIAGSKVSLKAYFTGARDLINIAREYGFRPDPRHTH